MARKVDNLWMSLIVFRHIRDIYALKSLGSTKKCFVYTNNLFNKTLCAHKVFFAIMFYKKLL